MAHHLRQCHIRKTDQHIAHHQHQQTDQNVALHQHQRYVSKQINTWHTTNIWITSAHRSTHGTPPTSVLRQKIDQLMAHHHQCYVGKHINIWRTTNIGVTSANKSTCGSLPTSANRSTHDIPPTPALRQKTDQHLALHNICVT